MDSSRSSNNFTDEILTPIAQGNHTVFSRVPFQVEDASTIAELTLNMKYDNDFVAYLNGVKVAQANPQLDEARGLRRTDRRLRA